MLAARARVPSTCMIWQVVPSTGTCKSINLDLARAARYQYFTENRPAHVREKECLAIKYVLGKLKHYLIATKFTVKCLSDHRSLSFLKNGRETGGRIARWALSLAEYDYEIEYIKGADNQLADLLSRMVKAETLPANRLIQGEDG